jgi:hypothetical protein
MKKLILAAVTITAFATPTLAADIKAGEYAEVGNIVTLLGQQVLCTEYRDADHIYVVSELTARKIYDTEYRINNNPRSYALELAWQAKRDAQKYVMARDGGYSCQWVQEGRYHVDEKEVHGKEKDLFYFVVYSLSRLDDNTKFWIFVNYNSHLLFAMSEQLGVVIHTSK